MKWHISALLAAVLSSALHAAPLDLEKGDRICIIGNALAERMQHHGWLEALIHGRFPRHELVFRNLAFPGDELTLRLRSANFGSPDDHLRFNQAGVIFAFFGHNESFGGPAGLDKFKRDLEEFIQHTLGQKYNGRSAPRLVLFSPLAHENLHDPNLPDGSENNPNLKIYAEAMAEVARVKNVLFVDLFAASRELHGKIEKPLTIDGIHLNEYGDRMLAPAIERALFSGLPAPERDPPRLERIRAAVLEKNFTWFERYRTVDGYSIYGGRADLKFVDGQTNREVMQREMEVLDVMTANRDKIIWAAARGEELQVDDSNTPPFIPVKTNLPGRGPDGAHIFLGAEEAIGKMTVHPGMKVNLFASEERFPELAKPVQMAFDPKGRLWVAAMPSYPHWKPKEEMEDKLLIIDDLDGDGKADRCKAFAGKLHVPTGFEFYNGGALVAQAPDLMFLKDTDGDDVADYRERVLNGLDSADTHHTMNSFTLDPGGALYFQEGTFHHTQVETVYGPPQRCANAGVFRYEPRAQKFEVYVSYAFANPHGHVFDRWGQDFVTDGTGNVNYYAPAFSGRIDFPRKHAGMEPFFQQRTRPCPGTEILSSRHFPEELQGNYLDANVIGFLGILQYRMVEKDSGFTGLEVDPIVQSSDPNFRPADLEIGPDGALYFLDWQNPIIGHMQHNLRDPSRDRSHGRVYRVTYPGRPLLQPVRIAGEPIDKLLDLLKEPENRVRYRAKIELGGRGSAEVIAAVKRWIETLDKSDADYEHHLLEALWVHQYHNAVNEELLLRLLRSPDYRARAAATRVLCYWRDRVSDPLGLLKEQAEDPYPRVRLEAVRACSFFREARAAEVALAALKHSMDYYLTYTLKETMVQLEPYWKKAVAAGASIAADNPAGVDYLLEKISTAELIKLPRTPLVYLAMLSRGDVIPDHREEALKGLAGLNKTAVTAELLAAIQRLDSSDSAHAEHVLSDLAHLLTKQPSADLRRDWGRLVKLSEEARRPLARQVAYVALVTATGSIDPVWQQAGRSIRALQDFLEAVPLIADVKLRGSAHERIQPLLFGLPPPLAVQAEADKGVSGRYVRIELPRRGTLTLAEVEVLSEGVNIATAGAARQSSEAFNGPPSKAIDGNTSGRYGDGGQTHTREDEERPWWELDLRSERKIDALVVWNRTEGNGQYAGRLEGFQIAILDSSREAIVKMSDNPAPAEKARFELSGDPAGSIRRAAMNAIISTGRDEEGTFKTLAEFICRGDLRPAAVRAISRLPSSRWPSEGIEPLIEAILSYAGKLPAEERTSAAARDALQLGSDLAALLPAERAQAVRRALRELGVPVIIIRPVPNLMLFDRTQIYVEAGKPVEIVFENIDIMPHNLAITKPGALEKVGLEAEKMAADPNGFARNFVPSIPEVLHATRLLQPQQTDKLSFTAPAELDDYPFVCTFPGHWRRMYGAMRVVRSLDDVPPEALAVAPVPLGEVRPFVQAWKVEDLAGKLEHVRHGRDLARGRQLFNALPCAQCHRMNGIGGQVGSDLAEVKKKMADGKMSTLDILNEMIEPSKVIIEQYRAYAFVLSGGRIVAGIVVDQNDQELRVRTAPSGDRQEEPIVIPLAKIRQRLPSEVSLMPLGLLNTLTEEEILDLLAYVISGGT
ncbi:MAG: discoidin domain-containing protein [Planctomycetes bacterium]|nr:discoidin domain-containing protein [Planctomycetota bacterium]